MKKIMQIECVDPFSCFGRRLAPSLCAWGADEGLQLHETPLTPSLSQNGRGELTTNYL